MDTLLLGVIILIISAIFHEIMHGVVAYKLGDPTAKLMGRLTLNPIPHIDPIGSILVPVLFLLPSLLTGTPPGVFFAWAKPVPVNEMHFKDPRKDMAIVALAGPLTNLVLAIFAGILFHLIPISLIRDLLFLTAYSNLMLGFLNLIPIPPLDGSKVFSIFLPNDLARSYMSIGLYGFFLVFLLLSFPIGPFSLGNTLSNLIEYSMHLLGL